MSTKAEIANREKGQAPQSIQELEQSFAIAARQRELLENYIRERLTPGKHFYQVAGSKNSLTKEGAELICLPHGYKPSYFKEGGPDQPSEDESPYQITVRCQLRKGESFAGEGIGSANSHVTRKDGQRVPRQPDPGLRHNATLKMAQKSAYIAATLNATAASEFFTQDVEDGAETAHEAPKPVVAALLCPIHKVEWFKRGKMRNSAHPIGDTGQWCNREDVQKTKGPLEADDELFPPETPQAHKSLKQLSDLWNAGMKELLYRDKKEMLTALGIPDDALVGDLDEAWAKLTEYRRQHPRTLRQNEAGVVEG